MRSLPHRIFYQFLNIGMSLETDSIEFLDVFDKDYSWFKTPSLEGTEGRRLTIQIDITKALVTVDGLVHSMQGHPNPVPQVYQLVLRGLLQSIESYLLFHAGVVAREGRALILAGPPGTGKTTLVMRLLEEGFDFLSDDYCPVHRVSRLVHPFPRSLWVKTKGQPAKDAPLGMQIRRGKEPIEMENLQRPVGNKPCEPVCLICLDPGDDADSTCELNLVLKPGDDGPLMSRLRQMEGVILEPRGTSSLDWRIKYPLGQGLTSKIKNLLDTHEESYWSVYREEMVCPDFIREPDLEPTPVHKAAFFLLRELKQEIPLHDPKEPPGKLFTTLCRLLKGVPCYRLRVGKLDRMIELILKASEAGFRK